MLYLSQSREIWLHGVTMPKGIRKTSDIAPLGVRMQPELKDALVEAARKNGRSLNAEVVLRLEQSFDVEAAPGTEAGGGNGMVAAQETGFYARRHLTELEYAFLEVLKKLPVEKRLALISLFK